MDFAAVEEAFQRRHVVIHNGGLVSSRYVAQVGKGNGAPRVGSRLEVTDEYLRDVFDQLDVLGTALASYARGTWVPDERDASATAILNRSYMLMLHQRWGAVRRLTEIGRLMKAAEAIQHSLSCNHWLSRMELEGPEEIEDEVKEWDTSALAGRFTLVQLVLLDRLDDAIAMVPTLVDKGEVSWGELQEWPILRRLREHQQFSEVARAVAPAKILEESTDRDRENEQRSDGGD